MYSHTTDTARTIVGIIGNVLSFALFASPMPTFWRVFKNKSVEEFDYLPYVASIMNCIMWIFYGTPLIHPHSTLVITINGVGLVLQLIYTTIYFSYTSNKKRVRISALIAVEIAFVVVLGICALKFFHTHTARSNLVGGFCTFFGIIMYGSPLGVMRNVIKTKSVEFMPLYLSLACFANGVCWTIYALLEFDLYILIGNGVGGFLGLLQLVLYGIYYKTTPKKGEKDQTEKPSQVQLSTAV